MGFNRQKVIDIALAQVGYHEKASAYGLDDFFANAGTSNWTKYARDLDQDPTFYNGNKNGYAWCDVFVDWCFVQAFGSENAKKLLCQPDRSMGAGCQYSLEYYRQHNQFYKTNPQIGDQIFFGSPAESSHTGIVYDVYQGSVFTVEGNCADQVSRQQYNLLSNYIIGYGRPNYDDDYEVKESNTGSVSIQDLDDLHTANINGVIDTVKEVQIWLNNTFSCGLAIDGLYGSETQTALVKGLQKALDLEQTGRFGTEEVHRCSSIDLQMGSSGDAVKILQAFLVCYGYKDAFVDGEFGIGTRASLIAFQKKHRLSVDGIAAQEVFTYLCR